MYIVSYFRKNMMKVPLIILLIVPGSFPKVPDRPIIFNMLNALPWNWKKDMPHSDYSRNIEIRLVNKNWMPQGPNLPVGDKVTDKYAGSWEDAFGILMKENIYTFTEKPLDEALSLLTEGSGYRQDQESIFVFHTISGDADVEFVKHTITVLAMRNLLKKYNVFATNMPNLQDSMEKTIIRTIFGSKANFLPLGETIGNFIDSAIKQGLMQPEQIHFMGYCYSSQLVGYVARYISAKNNNRKIKSITALDPYSIGLSGVVNKVLSKRDAQFVHAYHTNSIAYGTLYRRATADYIINSGWFQPGCYTTLKLMCSHRRIVTAFWYVILYPDLFVARRCPTWLLFKSCLCSWNKKVSLPFPPSLDPQIKGKYYLNTMSHKPYGFGVTGANCYTKNDDYDED